MYEFVLKEVYFVRDPTNKCPKGKLYSKYFNKVRSFQNHGLVSLPTKLNKSVEKETRITTELDDEISNQVVLFSVNLL